MQPFRPAIENPIVEKDILELERRINLSKGEKIAEGKFSRLRLAREIYQTVNKNRSSKEAIV